MPRRAAPRRVSSFVTKTQRRFPQKSWRSPPLLHSRSPILYESLREGIMTAATTNNTATCSSMSDKVIYWQQALTFASVAPLIVSITRSLRHNRSMASVWGRSFVPLTFREYRRFFSTKRLRLEALASINLASPNGSFHFFSFSWFTWKFPKENVRILENDGSKNVFQQPAAASFSTRRNY